jgi:CrcB protein
MLRYALSLLAVLMGGPSWPWGTLAANLLGSFGLGLLFVVGEGRTVAGVDARLLLGTGMMGGFTTYSTFNLEALRFAEAGQWGKVLLYIVSTVLVCLAAGAAGVALGRTVR